MKAPAVTPPALQLVLGDEELLVERAVRAAADAARLADPTAETTRVKVSDLTAPELAELVSPSLFAEQRVIVLEGAHDAGKDIAAAITSYLREPADGVQLVVLHTGGGRKPAKDLIGAMRSADAHVVECPRITKPADREAFVRNEIRRAGGKTDADAVSALIDSVGSDLRELASAAAQLVADTGGQVTAEEVRRYHRGRADVTGFAVAEKAITGDVPGALEMLRWAMQLGVPHVLVADALADGVRTVARVAGAGPGGPVPPVLRAGDADVEGAQGPVPVAWLAPGRPGGGDAGGGRGERGRQGRRGGRRLRTAAGGAPPRRGPPPNLTRTCRR